jgi:hypothetical protein
LDISEFDPFATPIKRSSEKEMEMETPGPTTPKARSGAGGIAETGTSRGQGGPVQGEGEVETETETEVSFNFSGFLKDLRMKSAEPIAKYLKSYVFFVLRHVKFIVLSCPDDGGDTDLYQVLDEFRKEAVYCE